MKVSDCGTVTALDHDLCQRIGEPRYRLWFHDKTKFSWSDERLTVGVPNRFFQEWLQKTFLLDLQASARAVFAQPMQVTFAIDPELFQAARRRESAQSQHEPHQHELRRREQRQAKPRQGEPHQAGPSPTEPSPTEPEEDGLERTASARSARSAPAAPLKQRARRWRRLEEFIVGPCNQIAHASAQAIVHGSQQGPNPLLLHGPVGTGKTHLLEGLFVGLRQSQPDARVLYFTAEDFTNRFLFAMKSGKLAGFRKQVRDCDALLVDDLHFLTRKLATQEEFLHTFDALVRDDRPVVVTSDCHPRLIDQFLPELTDRLSGGAVWGLDLPDLDTRRAILGSKALRLAGVPLAEDVLELFAAQLRGNVRELEGALHALYHLARVRGQTVNLELARTALAEVLRHSLRTVAMADVERALLAVLGITGQDLKSKQRSWMFSHPRMLAMYLGRKHTGATYGEIGQYLGGRNHSTAVAAEKKVLHWLRQDTVLNLGRRRWRVRELIERIERELQR